MTGEFGAKKIVAMLFASVLTTLISALIVFIVARVGVPVAGGIDPYDYSNKNKDHVITEREMQESSELALKEIQKEIQKARGKESGSSLKEWMKPVNKRSIYFSWLPWFILPFILSLRYLNWMAYTLLAPLILSIVGVFSLYEVVVFGVSAYVGREIRKWGNHWRV